MLASAKLSTKGQVVIPKAVRDRLGLEAGDSMLFAVDGDRLIVRKLALSDVLREADAAYREKSALSVDQAFNGLT
jgi:AbrB family looped-hinge helix DNA binding protein